MPTFLERATLFLDRASKAAHSRDVSYRRAALAVDVTFAVGATEHQEFGGNEAVDFTSRTEDFVGLASDLAFAGEFFLPERGDEIDWIDAREVLHTYKVLPRDGERCYRFTDQTKLRVRIFTVEIQPSAE